VTRFYISRALAVFLAFVFTATLNGSEPEPNKSRIDPICKVYGLNGLAKNPQFVKWVAETIPQVISPGTWNGGRLLTYQADAKVLVVYHNPAVQAEVAAFIDRLSEAKSKEAAPTAVVSPGVPGSPARGLGPQIVPAIYSAPAPSKAPEVLYPSRMPYPVPPPLKQPKHLFHLILQGEGSDTSITDMFKQLSAQSGETKETGKDPSKSEAAKAPAASGSFAFILRYEGEGIIDDTVAKLVTNLYKLSAQMESHVPSSTGYDLLGAVMGSLLGQAPPCAPAACAPAAAGNGQCQTLPSAPTAAGYGQQPGPAQRPASAPAPAQGSRPPTEPASAPAVTTPPRNQSGSSLQYQ
jgi:hypothetical protein